MNKLTTMLLIMVAWVVAAFSPNPEHFLFIFAILALIVAWIFDN